MKFDNVLAEVNGFGRFQLRTILTLVIPRLTLPFHFLLNNFINFIPSHHCNISSLNDGGVLRNLSLEERLIVSIPFEQDGSLSSCQMFSEPQFHLLSNFSNLTNLPTVPCQNGWIYDTTTFKSTLATEWDLVCDNRRANRAIATIFFMGVMVGAAVFGYFSDRFGRKKTLILSYIVTAFFGIGSAFSYNFPMYAAMRFFTGLGLSGISISSIVLCVEWVDIKHRTAVVVLMSLDWSMGCALLPALAYFLNDWRHLTAAVTSLLFPAILCWWWLPESARWLMSNGKVDTAHFYLSKCAAFNGRKEVMDDLKPEVLSKVILVENENRKYSHLDLVRTPRMRRRALLSGIVCWAFNLEQFLLNNLLENFLSKTISSPSCRWLHKSSRKPNKNMQAMFKRFGVACTYYGISLNISGFGVNIYLTQFIYGAIEIPAKAFIFFIVDKIGRRWTQAGTLIVTGLLIFCSMFIPADKGTLRTAVGAFGKMFSEGSFVTVFLYTTELYPTVMRQNGLGYCSSMARAGVSVSPLIMLLEEVWVNLPSSVFSLMALAAGLSALLLPETHNVRLPETIEDVEQTRRRSVPTSDEKSPACTFSS